MATTSRQSVTLFFNLMTQEGWGVSASFDLAQVFGMQWQARQNTTFDIQVDNIRFITDTPWTPTPVDTMLIDNMEDNDAQINIVPMTTGNPMSNSPSCGMTLSPNSTRNGYWYTFHDVWASVGWPDICEGCWVNMSSGGSTINPATYNGGLPVTEFGTGLTFMVPAGTSLYSAHYTGHTGPSGPPNYPFAGFGFDFVDRGGVVNTKSPYDVSMFTGVRFHAKKNALFGDQWRLKFPTVATSPVSAIVNPGGTGCVTMCMGGSCNGATPYCTGFGEANGACTVTTTAGSTSVQIPGQPCNPQCYDDFGRQLGVGNYLGCVNPALSGEWRFYQISFASLTQEGWGYKPYPGNDFNTYGRREIFGMQFQSTSATADIEFWVDDIRFY
jgi:hypothetical protein